MLNPTKKEFEANLKKLDEAIQHARTVIISSEENSTPLPQRKKPAAFKRINKR